MSSYELSLQVKAKKVINILFSRAGPVRKILMIDSSFFLIIRLLLIRARRNIFYIDTYFMNALIVSVCKK